MIRTVRLYFRSDTKKALVFAYFALAFMFLATYHVFLEVLHPVSYQLVP